MSSTILNLIIQLLSGAAGSGLLAKYVSQLNLGPIANLITGRLAGLAAATSLARFSAAGLRLPRVAVTSHLFSPKSWEAEPGDQY
jgi:hypothetical protein